MKLSIFDFLKMKTKSELITLKILEYIINIYYKNLFSCDESNEGLKYCLTLYFYKNFNDDVYDYSNDSLYNYITSEE